MNSTATDTWNGDALFQLIADLYPIMRSITGPGVRESLKKLQTVAPITIHEVPSGTQVLDWTVPDEWHFNEAWIDDANSRRIIDARNSRLHVLNFSMPVDGTFTRDELMPHLYSIPEQPHCIPYRTSYYADQWGFCLSHDVLQSLGEGPFRVKIDAQRKPGVLNYGELYLPGQDSREVLVSTHICHPQLANDNLSGMVLAAALAASLSESIPHMSWRFLFVPGTIGAITWLARNRARLASIAGGMVLTGLGDDSSFNWKSTRSETTWIDRLVSGVLKNEVPGYHHILPFSPYGYDERQYGSPGFNLPVGRLTRAVHGTFPEYHTSADNLQFIKPKKLEESLDLLKKIVAAANADFVYENLSPYGEPHLGRRGLYNALGARTDPGKLQMAFLWLLNQSDGQTSMSQISARSGIPMDELAMAAGLLQEKQLLRPLQHASAQA